MSALAIVCCLLPLRGITGLGRKFRIIDDDGNRQLSLDEFSKAINEHALDFSDNVRAVLFFLSVCGTVGD